MTGRLMCMELLAEWELVGETEVPGENLPQCLFVHHKSHITWPVIEPEIPVTNNLSYNMASWAVSMNLTHKKVMFVSPSILPHVM
jgi:hypothetical protein